MPRHALPLGVVPVVTDRRAGPNFWLSEIPCWWLYTWPQFLQLEQFVGDFLQPLRNQVGAIILTSGRYWKSGCSPRTGGHSQGGLDFYTRDVHLADAHRWAAENLPGRFGELLLESTPPHMHATPRGVGGQGQVLHEVDGGGFALGPDPSAEGSLRSPFPLPGFTVTAGSSGPMAWLLIAGVLLALLKRNER